LYYAVTLTQLGEKVNKDYEVKHTFDSGQSDSEHKGDWVTNLKTSTQIIRSAEAHAEISIASGEAD